MPMDRIRDKLRQSETLFDGLARLQTKLTILVPANNREEAEAEFHALGLNMPDASVEEIGRWDEFAFGVEPIRFRRSNTIVAAVGHHLARCHATDFGLGPDRFLVEKQRSEFSEHTASASVAIGKEGAAGRHRNGKSPRHSGEVSRDRVECGRGRARDCRLGCRERAPAGSGCGRLQLAGDPTVNSEFHPVLLKGSLSATPPDCAKSSSGSPTPHKSRAPSDSPALYYRRSRARNDNAVGSARSFPWYYGELPIPGAMANRGELR